MKPKVYVGLSGGVDSSLTAALLLEKGYQVVGVYMKNWTQDLPGTICPWADDLADAKRVAVQLDIDFKVFDFKKDYQQKVVNYMIDEYKAGRTPNPDIMCNQEIKFKLFLETALSDGADMIATGHYAKTNGGKLYKAKDTKKDQTYFLYRVTHRALIKSLFPMGEFTKTEVRSMAEKRGLVTASKKDSVGICFVGSVDIKDFLSQYVKTNKGKIIDQQSGIVIGEHDGAIFYTIGQRHGLYVGGGLPYYVCNKNMKKNEVYVTTDLNNAKLWQSKIQLKQIHWITQRLQKKQPLQVRLRHRASLVNGTFDGSKIILSETQRAIAAGQSAVLYSGDQVLGGGIIC